MKVLLPPHLASLLEEARAGSSDALGQLFEAFRPVLRLVASRAKARERKRVRPKISDSDLVQDTFVTAFEEFKQFRGRSPEELLAWLERILQRLTANSVAHFKQARRDVSRETSPHDPHSQGRARESVDTRTETPVEKTSRKETRAAIRRALQTIPEKYRQVLEPYYAEGESVEAIAEQLGLSVEAVRKRWVRGLPLWRAAIEKEPQATCSRRPAPKLGLSAPFLRAYPVCERCGRCRGNSDRSGSFPINTGGEKERLSGVIERVTFTAPKRVSPCCASRPTSAAAASPWSASPGPAEGLARGSSPASGSGGR